MQDTNHIVPVAVLHGAPQELCSHRELRHKYQTNRSIKTWATFFMLKSLTPSGYLKNWQAQKQDLLAFCKMNDGTFRARLAEMQKLNLLTIEGKNNLALTSYKKAASILGIEYQGTYKIFYDTTLKGTQVFQYILRAEEVRSNQNLQLEALRYNADKNPLLLATLTPLLARQGCNMQKLQTCKHYFQEQLLLLQQQAFREGSAIVSIIHQLRADINRSVQKIKEHHQYKSAQSVSYMKRRMHELAIMTITKKFIVSKERTRLYVPDGTPHKRDGYKWLPHQQATAWVLTDQLQHLYKTEQHAKKTASQSKAA